MAKRRRISERERQVLIECARPNSDDDDLADLLSAGVDWGRLTKAAARHGLIPLLLRRLKALPEGLAPVEVLTPLRRAETAALAVNQLMYEELARIVEALDGRTVPSLVLKGPALAATIYSDRDTRLFNDLDLMIRDKDWGDALEVLVALGYRPEGWAGPELPPRLDLNDALDHDMWFTRPGVRVELKLDLLELGIRMRVPDDVWWSSRLVTHRGMRIRVLGPEHQLLHLCVHLNRHGYRRLVWWHDIGLLLDREDIDWARFTGMARVEGVTVAVFNTLKSVRRVLGAAVPEEALASVRPSGSRQRLWASVWPITDVDGFRGVHDGPLVFYRTPWSKWFVPNLVLTGRTHAKLSYFGRKLFPSREFLVERYGLRRKEEGSYLTFLFRRYKDAMTHGRS